jgi:hypothetical protein
LVKWVATLVIRNSFVFKDINKKNNIKDKFPNLLSTKKRGEDLTWYYGILRSKTKRQGIEELQDCGHVARGKNYVAQAGFCVLVQ